MHRRLQKQRRKYEAFLISLVVFILYLAHTVLILPSIYSLVHYGNVALLLVSLVTLGLFFATGMYSEKIAYAYKFVPQANRALRPLNIYLNTRQRSRLSFFNIFRYTSAPSSPPVPSSDRSASPIRNNITTNIAAPGTDIPVTASAPLRRTSSSSSHSSASSARSAQALRSPPSSRPPSPTGPPSAVTRAPPSPPSSATPRGVPIPPIPPAQNPRGELIFSSRVSASFREGYERYRGEWERRRAEAAEQAAQAKSPWWRWGGKRRTVESGKGSSGSEKENQPGRVSEKKMTADRGRRSSAADRSKSSSRQPSPHRSTHRSSVSVISVTSTVSTPASSRAPSPSRDSPSGSRRSSTGEVEGRIRAESFSALLETMDESSAGIPVVDFVPGLSSNG